MNIFEKEWDLVVSLGIKCNLSSILDRAGRRYISSPFDNMDSVEGLSESGALIAQRFSGYFEDKAQWGIRNWSPSKSTEIHAKILWHKSFPNLYYPHFHPGWFDPEIAPLISAWTVDPQGSMDLVWDGFIATYGRRQERLVNLLSKSNRVLFVRADVRDQLRRLEKCDLDEDIKSFCTDIGNAYPSLDFGLLYFSCQKNTAIETNVLLNLSEFQRSAIIQVPDSENEAVFIEQSIRQLNVLPRDAVTSDKRVN
jgi:hypothetical protein